MGGFGSLFSGGDSKTATTNQTVTQSGQGGGASAGPNSPVATGGSISAGQTFSGNIATGDATVVSARRDLSVVGGDSLKVGGSIKVTNTYAADPALSEGLATSLQTALGLVGAAQKQPVVVAGAAAPPAPSDSSGANQPGLAALTLSDGVTKIIYAALAVGAGLFLVSLFVKK